MMQWLRSLAGKRRVEIAGFPSVLITGNIDKSWFGRVPVTDSPARMVSPLALANPNTQWRNYYGEGRFTLGDVITFQGLGILSACVRASGPRKAIQFGEIVDTSGADWAPLTQFLRKPDMDLAASTLPAAVAVGYVVPDTWESSGVQISMGSANRVEFFDARERPISPERFGIYPLAIRLPPVPNGIEKSQWSDFINCLGRFYGSKVGLRAEGMSEGMSNRGELRIRPKEVEVVNPSDQDYTRVSYVGGGLYATYVDLQGRLPGAFVRLEGITIQELDGGKQRCQIRSS